MNKVRATDRVKRRLESHMRNIGNEQTYRPKKSPTLKTRKCKAVKSKGCVAGFVG